MNDRGRPPSGLISQWAALIPDGVADRIGPSEGPGPGSSPGREIYLTCPASVPEARQPSKLQDEVRFLGGELEFRLQPAQLDVVRRLHRLPSGGGKGCNLQATSSGAA
jgi:hypothetical protein